ncbi:MAG: DNA polymerase III subunit alpha [Mycoplasmataceae bacterium]|nr:DNA polymerase III subunit alpha [Mycoplasmataceae bacterium]
MNNPNLLTRSSYTFFNSLLKIQDIIDLSLRNGFSTAFLVDKNIMYGSMEFYFKCKKNNIKPIIGLQVEYNEIETILIAKNYNGYKKLMEISSNIKLEKKINIIDKNLIIFKELLIPVLYKEKEDIVVLKSFNSISESEQFLDLSSHFLSRKEFEVLNGINVLKKIDIISEQVNIEINERKNILPSFFHKGEKVNSKEFLEKELKEKLQNLLNSNKNLDRTKYIDRTKHELSVISKMKFESYFLIVADIINWSKNQGIFVGPGRGSAPGSIISFLLNITTVDPIENNLLFERFLNSDRVSMPDIDIDFEDVSREKVIQYISTKYGKENVAQIITYQTLRARMSFKDIARINGLSATETNSITKLIPEDLTLDESYKKSKVFKEKINSSDMLKKIFKSAKLIEGLPRQFSTHAAGIVISDEPIYKSVPVQNGYGEILQTQYSMDYMEYNGLLKIDILGLRNLSFIKKTLDDIKLNKDIIINLKSINFNDQKVFSLLSSGRTSGIFQLESPGMRASLKDIKVTSFEDIVAVTSLFRPGPMKMIPEFASRKRGDHPIAYINDEIKTILKLTYGIIIYQEQIMQIVQVFSNFSLSKADILRRAISKKDINLLKSLKQEFFNGAIENGHDNKLIQETYDLIYEFSNYGFNRSHAFAYTIISYWLAWLKINYPLEFMNSLLNSVIGNSTKTPIYISEAEDLGIKINEPSIFDSFSEYRIIGKEIFIGLKTIKKIGESIIKNICTLKKNIFKEMNIIDFFIECEKAKITNSALEILIKANALRNFGFNKETLLNLIGDIEEYLNMIRIKNENNISFNKEIVPAPKIKKLQEKKEKDYFNEVMGFSLNDGESYKEIKILENKLNINICNLEYLEQNKKVIFIGEVISVREISTKTGQKMAFANITNGKRKINITCWPNIFQKFSDLIKPTNKLIFYGTVDLNRGETIIINNLEEIK